MKSEPLAAIDVGTNTFRLLIGRVLHDSARGLYDIEEICSERVITRLGEGIALRGAINEGAMNRSIGVLKMFHDLLLSHTVEDASVIATSALRDARNSDQFIKRARQEAGLDITVIPGREEARLTAMGMMMDLTIPGSALFVDIGGGSTELICTVCRDIKLVLSLDLGVVYLCGLYMKHDPPSESDLRAMKNAISLEIGRALDSMNITFDRNTMLAGTAGTVTTIAAIKQGLKRFEQNKIHGVRITLQEVQQIFDSISTIPAHERAHLIPFEPARLDIIVPGTLILLTLMEMSGLQELNVSGYGLREGALLEMFLTGERQ